jgi:uncharacterized membrane protein
MENNDMSQVDTSDLQSKVLSPKDEAAKTSALIGYALMAIGLLTMIFWVVGAVWAMVKKGDAAGSIFQDHYSNIISTFWWSIVWGVIGFVLTFFVVGWFILIAVWFWTIYRTIKGIARLTSNKPYKKVV